jgi:hypothetical protein
VASPEITRPALLVLDSKIRRMNNGRDPNREGSGCEQKKRAEDSARLVGLAHGQAVVHSGYLPELEVVAGCD